MSRSERGNSVVSDIAKRIRNLPPDKLALLLQRTREKKEESIQVISPQPRDTTIFPLSFAEQRIWFFEQWETESAPYNVSLSVRLTGTLQIATLERVIQALVQRHESLHTTFTVLEEQPMQVIAPMLPLPLPLVNLSGL